MTDMQYWLYRDVPKTILIIVVMFAMAFLLPPVPR